MPITKYGKNTPRKQTESGNPLNDAMTNEVQKQYQGNLTNSVALEVALRKLPEDTVTQSAGKIAYNSMVDMESNLNNSIERIANDKTMTPAKQLLEKSKVAEKQFKITGKLLDTASRESLQEFKTASSELFSSDLTLTPADASMLPAMFAHITEHDNLGSIISGSKSPQEVKMALALARDYPTIVKAEDKFEDLVGDANRNFTPEVLSKVNALRETGKALQAMSESFSKSSSDLLNSKMLTDVKSGIYNA